jgi:hypothetical protein
MHKAGRARFEAGAAGPFFWVQPASMLLTYDDDIADDCQRIFTLRPHNAPVGSFEEPRLS